MRSALYSHEHYLLQIWLIFVGVVFFGFAVAWNEGLLTLLIETDRSKISLGIGILLLFGTAHCARRITYLSAQLNGILRHEQATSNSGKTKLAPAGSDSITDTHLRAMLTQKSESENDENSLIDLLISRAKGSHDIGWFLVDLLLKLGLVGTIVGFIVMLSSVANTATIDVTTMQKVLKQMSSGMGTALFTTLAGLVGSLLLGFQYLLLDKGADNLIERVVDFSNAKLSDIEL
ncbi:MAG: MotA/TolQ/ExbB proton channel family protein [Pseudomonadota bacterium]